MATTSATIRTNESKNSWFWVYWERVSTDIGKNTTKIYWSCGVKCGYDLYLNAIKMSAVTINGTKVYSGGTYSNFMNGDHRIASGYLDIPHNSDGSKTFSVSAFTGWLYLDHNYSASEASYTLPSIARASSLTASNGTLGVSQTLKINRKSTSFRHILRRTVVSSDTNVLIGKSQNVVSYDWEPSLSWASYNKSGNKISCKLELETYTSSSASSPIGTVSKNITLTIPENSDTKPTVTIAVAPVNPSFPSALSSLYIQGKSKAKVTCTASPKYNATISEYTVSAGTLSKKGSSAAPTTDYLQTAGSIPVTAKVKDSRGFYGKTAAATNITVLPYSKPTIAPVDGQSKIICERSDANGASSRSGTYLRIRAKAVYSSLDSKNTCKMQYRYKIESGAWSAWIDLTSSNGVVNATLDRGFSAQSAYTVELRAVDSIENSVSFPFKIPTDTVNLHLRAGGKGIGIGRYCAGEGRLDVGYDAFFEKGVTTHGEVEMYGDTPHIDFHHANSNTDFTSRIIENANGILDMKSPNGFCVNGKRVDNQSVTLDVKTDEITKDGITTYIDRITNVSYTAKYNELLGAVFVRIYGTINAALNVGYDYDLFTIDSRVPDSNAALSVKCAKNAMALAKTSSNGSAIQIRPLESGINGYDVYITGFWFV